MMLDVVRLSPRRLVRGLLAMSLALGASVAAAQTWPSKPVRIVVPFPAGGTTDLIARLISTPMSQELGQSVVVEIRPGAAGLLGADAVAKSAPDGHTYLMANISYPLAVLVAERAGRMPFNANADLQAVSVVANVPLVLTAPPANPAANLREFAELVKKPSDKHYTYGSTGPGSYMHVFGEWFSQQIRAPLTHVPFKGAAPLKLELLAGRVDLGGDQLSSSLAEVRSGTLKAMAVTSPQRSPALPDVPTVSELGFKGFETEGWNGLLAPAGTPEAVLKRMQQAVANAVKDETVRQRLESLGAEASASEPAQMAELLKRQFDQFRPMVDALQLQ